ncbi:TIGR02587 family membrane protein [Shewanella sp.]|nr:TIGR02587 family membrane protein [Shewanella sp.]
MKYSFNFEDASQIFVGAFALAVPISFSEEAWRLGETLPVINLCMLLTLSVIFLTLYTYESVFQRDISARKLVFILRIVTAYCMTAMVVMLVLFCINKFPLLSDPLVALKRVIIISMPASMGAIVVDSFDKE